MRRVCLVFVVFVSVLILSGEARALCVKSSQANLRVGPGTDYAVGWTVQQYFPLEKVGASSSGEWYAVRDIDGDVFWVHKSLVTNEYHCGSVAVAKVNVRTGPGTRYGKLFSKPAEKYYSFRILKRSGAWLHITDGDKNTGWLHENYCITR